VAVIDVGSSAIRMVVAQIEPDGSTVQLESLQRAAPLGQEVFTKGKLSTRAINLAIEILRGYLEICEPYDVRVIRAVATAAVREAQNRDLFVERVYMATGISVDVITGAEEHRLVYAAVRDAFRAEGLPLDGESLIVELGSGSTELTRFHAGEVTFTGTFSQGTIRLRHAVKEARPGPGTRGLLRRHIVDFVDGIARSCPLGGLRAFIAVGGDARFAADRILGGADDGARVRAVPRGEFLRLARAVGQLRPEEIARRHGLPFEDCETLGPALMTYAELYKRTGAAAVLVPYVSMREGLVLEIAAEETGRALADVEAQIFASAEAIGRHFQYDEAHARHVAELACQLFDALAGEHGLGRRERRLLRVAALLHDVGMFISNSSHHRHSEYVIGASDLFGVRPEEKAIVACVARYHRRALPTTAHAAYAELPRHGRATVSKLAAILRIADGLDRSHDQKVRAVSAQIGPSELVLVAEPGDDLALERMALRSKGDLFEEVFGRAVVLEGGSR
jgi:exopolyphosphatase / guanosine-5'-triphosphate,3'-diphosphate pyrophosphatase